MKTSRFMILLAALLVLMGGVLPMVAQEDDNVLVMARAADATGLDPHTQTAFASLRLIELVYEPLVQLDPDLNIIPALAESWEFSDDVRTLTFKLRQGVTFHNGAEFTADDVVATFERILDEETAAAQRANFLSIQEMETPDDYTVVFHLSEPDLPILAALATANAAIADSADIESGAIATEMNGTGPFVLESFVPEEQTILRANENWWGDGPFVDGIDIRIIPDETSIVAGMRAGEYDFALLNDPVIATLLDGEEGIILNRAPAIAYHVLQLNAQREPLNILEVRQAISCAIDRQEVLDAAALGEGQVTGPLTIPAYRVPTEELFCYQKDLDRARELLAQAGYADGFDLTIIASEAEPPTSLPAAQSIQAQLAELGINVTIEPMELSVYVDRWLAADFDAAVAQNGGRADPYSMYVRYWTSTGNLNSVAGYIDETLDELMAAGRTETDYEARYEIFRQFQQHLTEMAPWIWLFNGQEYTAQQEYVTGFQPNPTDSLYTLAYVQIERE